MAIIKFIRLAVIIILLFSILYIANSVILNKALQEEWDNSLGFAKIEWMFWKCSKNYIVIGLISDYSIVSVKKPGKFFWNTYEELEKEVFKLGKNCYLAIIKYRFNPDSEFCLYFTDERGFSDSNSPYFLKKPDFEDVQIMNYLNHTTSGDAADQALETLIGSDIYKRVIFEKCQDQAL